MACALLGSLAIGSLHAFSRNDEIVGTTWTGEPGITERVADIMARQALAPPDNTSMLTETHPEIEAELEGRVSNPRSPKVSQWPLVQKEVGQPPDSLLSPQTIGVNFRALMSGPAATESNAIPPDSMGEVGPTQIITPANRRIRVYSKTGVLGPLNVTTDVFFESVRNGTGTTDPRVRYDRLSQRWFVVMANTPTTNNRILIAVSSGPIITGQTSFTFFQFTAPAGTDDGRFADYPSLGVDRFALYIGANMFGGNPQTLQDTSAWVVNKANLLAGTLTVTAFRGLTGGLTTGAYSPQGVDNDDPQATSGYIIGSDVGFFGLLNILRVNNPGGVPTITPFTLDVPLTSTPLRQVAQASVPLDIGDDRLFEGTIHRNKITGAVTLWTAHSIAVDLTGAVTGNGNAGGDRNAARWYEIGDLDSTPTLVQSGTLFDPAPANPRGFIYGTVTGTGQGHMGLGATYASASELAGSAVAGRYRTQALGTIGTMTVAKAGISPYNQAASGRNRWGDYSKTMVDPVDDMTMWSFQEYMEDFSSNNVGVWGVQATQLLAPPPATPASAVPFFVPRNTASATVTVTGTSTSGSEFFDPGPDTGGPGYTNHIAASVSGGVTVNSITFNTPTQVTLDISTVGATCTTKDVTVTNPDGQASTGSVLLTTIPTAPTASGNSPVCAGQTLQLSATSTVPGVTYAWTGPNGFTSSEQNPTIVNVTTAASGTYSARVSIGGCASTPATTSVTVNPSPNAPIATNNGAICQGSTLQLMATTVVGATYSWTGPGGFTSNQQNPSIPNATPAASGTYSVTVTVGGGCPSPVATTTATVIANGGACNDGQACTTNDLCGAGTCGGQPVVCTPSDQCHLAGTCNPGTGDCSNPAAPEGTACSDGDACTTNDACRSGACVGGPTLRCDDFNDCTSDRCDSPSGTCVHNPLNGTPCDDRDNCTVGDTCGSGTCVGTTIVAPAEVAHLRLTNRTTLVWDSAGGAGPGTVHDVVRGLAHELPVGSGSSEICLSSDITPATTTDAVTPAAGRSFWYLVRGRNSCGTGTYGFASNGTPRTTSACP